ncbi:MAG: type II toxin-antitoxin system RelE/ParE family toxin [Candidatus Hydrogenedentes bacterium]|nr:type II toxin-antitoxin system RelE/ParE family toxin [Candidatus Hydrogenedentota bacterium]
MAKLVFTKRAQRDYDCLDTATKKRMLDILKVYAVDPMKHAKKLSQSRLGTYRYRIGEYRVVFDFEGEKVVVLRIGHRRDIYRH